MNDNLEHYHTLDGSTPRARRASLAAARACYRKRFGVEPPPGRVFRLRPAVAVAFALPLTHSGLTCHSADVTNDTRTAGQMRLEWE